MLFRFLCCHSVVVILVFGFFSTSQLTGQEDRLCNDLYVKWGVKHYYTYTITFSYLFHCS